MEHDHYKFRPTVYVLAIIDIVLSSLSLSWTLLIVVALSVAPDNFFANELAVARNRKIARQQNIKLTDEQNVNYTQMQQAVAVLWVAIVIQTMACLLQTVAAIKLLNASKPNCNPGEALINCRFWRRVTLFFTFLMFVQLFFGNDGRNFLKYMFIMCNIILRMICIWYVQSYMRELLIAPAYGGILPTHTHHITPTAVHPHGLHGHAYYPTGMEPKPPSYQMHYPASDLPPPYSECVKQPVVRENELPPA